MKILTILAITGIIGILIGGFLLFKDSHSQVQVAGYSGDSAAVSLANLASKPMPLWNNNVSGAQYDTLILPQASLTVLNTTSSYIYINPYDHRLNYGGLGVIRFIRMASNISTGSYNMTITRSDDNGSTYQSISVWNITASSNQFFDLSNQSIPVFTNEIIRLKIDTDINRTVLIKVAGGY